MLKNRAKYWKYKVWRRVFSKKVGHLSSNKIYVAFTFDTEEDWDNRAYYDSYKYVSSGAFFRLVNGFDERGINATFYVTYNVARDRPAVLNYLEERNQRIGVHVHPHNFRRVMYPYVIKKKNINKKKDNITFYSFTEKINYMKLLKDQIESVVGYEILLYRSGLLLCDNETIKAAKLTGFKAISNHPGIYYMKRLGIWNLGAGMEDLFDFNTFNELSKYIIYFKERTKGAQIIVFSAHPMLLYNHATEEIREKELNTFFAFIDYLNSNKNVEIIDQYQLLRMVREWRGAK